MWWGSFSPPTGPTLPWWGGSRANHWSVPRGSTLEPVMTLIGWGWQARSTCIRLQTDPCQQVKWTEGKPQTTI